ncbi:hypothetical protein CCACVL1_11201 [Corchorus capsularis]|uniref:Uncharacterized protein n=1 Tax=Corchorus capsularis TaxID=210143 RepID=A0A1R3IMI6_COCAP|nr:hypothetical protein CCACVL1_11201 [Corchorus capsularis]
MARKAETRWNPGEAVGSGCCSAMIGAASRSWVFRSGGAVGGKGENENRSVTVSISRSLYIHR